MKTVIAIIGGIGSGKSVVSEVLRTMNYPVYDCDSNAKRLMNDSELIKHCLIVEFGSNAVGSDGSINRTWLSGIVFGNDNNLKKLNSIVHPVVISDFNMWVEKQHSAIVFVETAILRESGMDKYVDEIWEVTAPVEVRIERVKKRNGMSEEAIRSRMKSQVTNIIKGEINHAIVNDGNVLLLPQIVGLIRQRY